MSTSIDMRCPADPRRLFGRIKDARIVEGNLLEFACLDCRKQYRRDGDRSVVLVLHLFNLLGECVDTEVVRSG